MLPEIERILRLQSIDTRSAALEKEIAQLPRYIAAIEKTLDSHKRRLEADKAALTANQKERKKLEGDIQIQQQKITKLRDQMLLAKNNDQYRAFQHEIEYCETEIRKAEDRILELMGESEALDVNVKTAEAALKDEQAQVDAEKKRARDRMAQDQGFLAEHNTERAKIVAELKPQLVTAYDRIRKKSAGIAIAEVEDGRCSACQITLRQQFQQDLRKGDQVMFCESCGRILYLNPPKSFEADVAP
ncbi:MAG: C4-type zinc ribbon domain-containing protein [Bryobacteraceae bacterium]